MNAPYCRKRIGILCSSLFGFSVLSALLLASSSCSSSQPRAAIVLCAGDSLTDSEYPLDLERLLRRSGFPARVLNFGRKGDTSGEYRRFLEKEKAALADTHPDFVLLQLGTNDVRLDGDQTGIAAFDQNMRAIVAIFRGFVNRRGEESVLLLGTIPPVPASAGSPFGQKSRERVDSEINPALRGLARDEKLILVDNYALFSSLPELLPDVHPSREGYRRLARNWYEALASRLRR